MIGNYRIRLHSSTLTEYKNVNDKMFDRLFVNRQDSVGSSIDESARVKFEDGMFVSDIIIEDLTVESSQNLIKFWMIYSLVSLTRNNDCREKLLNGLTLMMSSISGTVPFSELPFWRESSDIIT